MPNSTRSLSPNPLGPAKRSLVRSFLGSRPVARSVTRLLTSNSLHGSGCIVIILNELM